MQTKTSETKVKDTCDTLITWGFCCTEKAEFLIKRTNSPEYAIMCGKHKQGFQRQYPNEQVVYMPWTLELNQQLADAANEFWSKQNVI